METPDVSHFLVLLGKTSAQAGVLVVLVLAAQWLFRKQLTPLWRCNLWLLVAARLLLPFSFSSAVSVFNLLPHAAEINSPSPPQTALVTSLNLWPMKPSPAGNAAKISNTKWAGPETAFPSKLTPSAQSTHKIVWSWPLLVFGAWLGGVLLLAAHVMMSSLRLWRRCLPLPAPARQPAIAVLDDCCLRLRLCKPPMLLESREVGSPALHGLFRPRLLLPVGFTGRFSPAELRFVFLHELAHLKRRDLPVNWVMVVLQIIHWFNPLVWWGFSRWRAERELACDAIALEAAGVGQNKEYGRTILRLLDTFTRPLATPGVVGILEEKRQLRRRIGMIANYVPTRGWPGLAVALIGVLALIGLTDARSGASTAPNAAGNPPVFAPAETSSPAIQASGPPQAPAAALAEDDSTLAVTVFSDGSLLLGASPCTLETLQTRLKQLAQTHPNLKLTIHADKSVQWDRVIKLMDAVKAANISRISMRTDATGGDTGQSSMPVTPTGGGSFSPAAAPALYSVNRTQSAAPVAPVSLPPAANENRAPTAPAALAASGLAAPVASSVQDSPAAAAVDSELANQLIGAWILVGSPGHVGKAPSAGGRIKFFTGDHWCITQADAKTGVVLFHHGGTYTLKGDTYFESVDYANSSTITHVGNKNQMIIKIEGDTLTSIGKGNPWNEVWKRLKPTRESPALADLTGTWAYAGKPGETNAAVNPYELKFCADGCWCDTGIDPRTGVVVIHHGGTYAMKRGKYVEACQYGNPTSMPLIGQDAKFNIKIEGDTLTLIGIGNPWNEVWKRLD